LRYGHPYIQEAGKKTMRGTQFAELNDFVAVAECGNFTKAATHVAISPATLSQTIRELEERLRVRLLNCTTRSVALTEAGERLLARLRPVLDDYEAAIDSVNSFRDKPAGLIRLTMPPVPATWLVGPSLPRFLAQYPDIRIEISVTTELVDIVANHLDAGIRLGRRLERDMIAVKLGELRFAGFFFWFLQFFLSSVAPVECRRPEKVSRRLRPESRGHPRGLGGLDLEPQRGVGSRAAVRGVRWIEPRRPRSRPL
jgi:DNA-binding transcriptional LysR family regulator